MATTQRQARIGGKHPVRRNVASLPNYFDRLIDAIELINGYLTDHGMALDDQHVLNLSGGTEETVTLTIPILVDRETGIVCSECDCPVELDNVVFFQYYKLRSGRYEVTTYIS